MLRRFSTLRLLFRPTVLNHARLSRFSPSRETCPFSFFSFLSLFFFFFLSLSFLLSSPPCTHRISVVVLSLLSLFSPLLFRLPSRLHPFALYRWIRSINRNQHRHRDEPFLNHIVQWDLNGAGWGRGVGERGEEGAGPHCRFTNGGRFYSDLMYRCYLPRNENRIKALCVLWFGSPYLSLRFCLPTYPFLHPA